MAGKALHLLLTFLALSLLLSFIDLPTTNARYLVHETASTEDTFQNMKQVDEEGNPMGFLNRRMEFEINRDYPVSGANKGHTPNPTVKD